MNRSPLRFSLPPGSLTFQIFFLLVLPLTLLVLLITFTSISLHQSAMRNMVGERDERAVRAVAQTLNENIYSRAQAIYGLALRAGHAPQPAFNQILTTSDYLMPDFRGGLALLDQAGMPLAATGKSVTLEIVEFIEIKDLQPLLIDKNISAFISNPIQIPEIGDDYWVMVAAPAPDENLLAVGIFSVKDLAQSALSSSLSPEERVYALIVDQDQRLIHQEGDLALPERIASHPGVLEALAGETGTIYGSDEDVEKVIAFSQVAITGWALVIEEPWEEATSPLLRTTVFAPLSLVPILLLALIALGFVSRQIVQPMQALATKAAELSWGNFGAIEEPVGGIAEIHRLQTGLIHMAKKVQSAQQSLHSYIGAITAGQEEERRRLARDLHDDTIQALIALKQRIQLLEMDTHNREAAQSLVEVERMTEETIDNLRRLTRDLRPIYLEDLGLATALGMLANEAGKKMGIPIQFHLTGREKRLSSLVELALYRIAQEALSNVARHSQASSVRINLSFSPQSVLLQIIDDGKGFSMPGSPADFAASGHYGLLGIHERSELIGASLKIESLPNQGTGLTIIVPETGSDRNQ